MEFWGSLPEQWSRMRNLEILYIYHNQLTGPLPRQYSEMSRLKNMWVPATPELTGLPRLDCCPLALHGDNGPSSADESQLALTTFCVDAEPCAEMR